MIEQIPEFEAREMWEDYCIERQIAGENPLPFYEWCKEEQIELV